MAVNSLGTFDFISLQGMNGEAPDIPQLTAQPVQRPGLDGSGIITLGTKGMPQQLRTVREVASIAAANDLGVAYKRADRSAALEIVFQGINYFDEYNVKYFVLHVDQPIIKRIRGSIGGVMGSGAGAIVTAVWTVLPVLIPAEDP